MVNYEYPCQYCQKVFNRPSKVKQHENICLDNPDSKSTKIIYREKIVEVPVEKIVYQEKIVEVPIEVEKIVYQDKIVDKIIKTPIYEIIDALNMEELISMKASEAHDRLSEESNIDNEEFTEACRLLCFRTNIPENLKIYFDYYKNKKIKDTVV